MSNFKIGETVRMKSYRDICAIADKFNNDNPVIGVIELYSTMQSYCGKELRIHSSLSPNKCYFTNAGFYFHKNMLEKITLDKNDEVCYNDNIINKGDNNMETEKAICCECGEEISGEVQTHNYDDYCEGCFSEKFAFCEDCGDMHEVDELHYINGSLYCNSCCFCCDDCSHYHVNDDLHSSPNGYSDLCERCFDEEYTYCDNCGDIISRDDAYYSERDYTYYCNDCRPNGYILDYHENIDIEFFGNTNNNTMPYLGVELEIDDGDSDQREEMAEYCINTMETDYIHCMEDGSLNDGFEIITQPATLNYHTDIKSSYQRMFDELSSNGWRSHDTSTCGYHIHFNRDFFGTTLKPKVINDNVCIARLLYIVEKFWKEMVAFSRRDYDKIEEWADNYKDKPSKIVKQPRGNLARYQAVNLTNRNTIEFRMFRGTLNIDTFIATLQLVNNIVTTAKYKSVTDIQKMDWSDLLTTEELQKYWATRSEKRAS